MRLIEFRVVIVGKPIHVVPGELRCPRCFGKDLVPSMPRGWRDAVMRVLGRIPWDCPVLRVPVLCSQATLTRRPRPGTIEASGDEQRKRDSRVRRKPTAFIL
jgi:hypothetical protein